MKNFKKIALSCCFILVLQTLLSGHDDPALTAKASADKIILTTNKKYKLLQLQNVNSINLYPLLKTKKVKQTPVTRLLNWDMKLKFRLSHNLNIIFSYN
ncbi:MAG: hypothetical protein JNJ40_07055 [Bacteroidia bacterium]|nr:hypothetical protein [Bacteroidia bacterium]